MSNGKIFLGIQYYFALLKIRISLKKTCTKACSEIPFSGNSYHTETSELTALQNNWPTSI